MHLTSFQSIALTLGLCLVGCSGSDSIVPPAEVGGSQSVGGSTSRGGTSSATGGARSTGGNAQMVGGANTGGMATGGAMAATGGNSPSVGGATGGSAQTGGSKAVGGGPATGGANATGGAAPTAGGSPATGGAKATGGVTSNGGSTTATGGVAPAGGSAAGGANPSGGSATGGANASGGTGGSTFVEDDGLDCTIGTLPSSLTSNTKLPDPFKKLDGTRIAAKADWRCRREEIVKLAEKYAYGTKTIPKAGTVTGTVSSTSITVKVSDNGKTASFSATVSLPTTGSAPYPAVVVLGGMGADTATIKAAGAAVISYDPYAVGAEGTGRAAKSGAYYTINGATSTTGLLMAWGWGVSRIIDVIAQADGKTLRADGIGVTGCSRFGKGAFIIGVFDQRVALTMPIESGTAGVPIWRGVNAEGGQTLSSAYGEQPWFGDAFSAFTGNNAATAPLDTHEVVALAAPRGLFIMDNPHIANLGPKSAHAAALAGAEVYKALGAGDNITYWSNIADGNHCAIRPEWKDPLTKNIQKFLLKTGTYAGVINAHSKATSTLSTWVDWTSPTLN